MEIALEIVLKIAFEIVVECMRDRFRDCMRDCRENALEIVVQIVVKIVSQRLNTVQYMYRTTQHITYRICMSFATRMIWLHQNTEGRFFKTSTTSNFISSPTAFCCTDGEE